MKQSVLYNWDCVQTIKDFTHHYLFTNNFIPQSVDYYVPPASCVFSFFVDHMPLWLKIYFRCMTPHSHEYFMYHALREAQNAFDAEEVPVGAVVVINHKIIARAYNQTELLKDPTAHAEMLSLTAACHFLGAKYLPDAILYVTVEPCLMCCGALYWSKIGTVVYGAKDDKNGYEHITKDTFPFHPKTKLVAGVLGEECAQLMKDFFKQKRK